VKKEKKQSQRGEEGKEGKKDLVKNVVVEREKAT